MCEAGFVCQQYQHDEGFECSFCHSTLKQNRDPKLLTEDPKPLAQSSNLHCPPPELSSIKTRDSVEAPDSLGKAETNPSLQGDSVTKSNKPVPLHTPLQQARDSRMDSVRCSSPDE